MLKNNVKFVSQFVKLAYIQNANMYMYINVHQKYNGSYTGIYFSYKF